MIFQRNLDIRFCDSSTVLCTVQKINFRINSSHLTRYQVVRILHTGVPTYCTTTVETAGALEFGFEAPPLDNKVRAI